MRSQVGKGWSVPEQSRSSHTCSSSIAVGLLVGLVRFYQRFLSPHKGFCCAHRVLHGGQSCSVAVKSILLEQGAWMSWKEIWQRFRECQVAARTLRTVRLAKLPIAVAAGQTTAELESITEASQVEASAASSRNAVPRLCLDSACCCGSCGPGFWI